MRTVFELMVEVACKLAQKPVRLRFQHNEGFQGLCRTDNKGLTTIDIEPEHFSWSERELLRIFLHEVSHAKHDRFIPVELEVSDRIPVSMTRSYNLKETRADKQASTWLKYAEENRDMTQPYFEGCLWSLYNSKL